MYLVDHLERQHLGKEYRFRRWGRWRSLGMRYSRVLRWLGRWCLALFPVELLEFLIEDDRIVCSDNEESATVSINSGSDKSRWWVPCTDCEVSGWNWEILSSDNGYESSEGGEWLHDEGGLCYWKRKWYAKSKKGREVVIREVVIRVVVRGWVVRKERSRFAKEGPL